MKTWKAVALAALCCIAGAAVTASAFPVVEPGSGVKDSAGYPVWKTDIAVSVSSTSTTSGTAAMAAGYYIIVCSTATHVDLGATGVVATTSERHIPASSPYPVKIETGGENYIAWIRDASDGTCIISKDGF